MSVILLILASATIPLALRQFNKSETNRIIKNLGNRYGAQESYILGSTNECIKQGPSGFGEVTGIHVCYRITAVAYYPRIEISSYTQQPEGLTTVSYIYTDNNGKTSTENISSMYTGDYNGLKSKFGEQLNLNEWDNITVSGISSRYDNKDQSRIDGIWKWSSSIDWLRTNTPSSELKKEIDEKIYNNQKLTIDTPTTTEAVKSGNAPLVIYIKDRYCHSPDILLFDYACVLPN